MGLKDSVEAFSKAVEGSTPKDVMMLVTQYLDTMKEIGANDKCTSFLCRTLRRRLEACSSR